MNIYDFDGTIYDGDSCKDIVLYGLKRYPKITSKSLYKSYRLNRLYKKGHIEFEAVKEVLLSFIFKIPNKKKFINDFVSSHLNKIKPLYEKISSYDLDNLSFEEITTIEEVIRKVREDDPEYSDVFLSLFYTDQVKKKKLCNVIIESFREMSWDSRKLLRSSDTFVIEGK